MGSVERLHSQAQRGSMQACRRLLVLSALVLLVAALNANEVQDDDAVVELGDNLGRGDGRQARQKEACQKEVSDEEGSGEDSEEGSEEGAESGCRGEKGSDCCSESKSER